MSTRILGISAYYHDSAASLIVDGEVLAAAQEERFTRKKHDPGFPRQAVTFCLDRAGIGLGEVDFVVFYDKPLLKFERLLETYLAFAPRGLRSFSTAMPVWLKDKLFLKQTLRSELAHFLDGKRLPCLLFSDHHRSHAASAFFPSPFERAAVLCVDGVGEWATTSVWLGAGNSLTPQWQIDFPHSLGLLYSAFTYYTGFKVNSGEYKLMGLAPYGEPKYVELIREKLIDLKPDGTFRLDMQYFNYATGLTMTNARFDRLFGAPPRRPESELTQREMDIARSIQEVTEEVLLRLGRTVRTELGVDTLCLAGGVALNCVANGRLLREQVFEDVWIQPAAGDAGGAVGAALAVWHEHLGHERSPKRPDAMAGGYLGPEYDADRIEASLKRFNARFIRRPGSDIPAETAALLAQGKVVGWFQGRMEFGPRALGARSILGDPRNRSMQSVMNLKIKFRESFRPFAPAVLAGRAAEWFDMDTPSPYMLLVSHVREEKREPVGGDGLFGLDLLKLPRSQIPAVTHVDYSARLQTVDGVHNPRFHALLEAFDALTGCPVLVNTSFNVRGEPIVGTPEDAYRCFMRTAMDALVIGDFILLKEEQPRWSEGGDWRQAYEPD